MEKRNKKETYFGQSDIKLYLNDVNKYGNVISREEEIELLKQIKAGDEKAETKLIYANLRYVIFEAKKFIGCGLDIEDLINEGNYGLIKAARRFDADNNENKFISYAVYWIRQAIFQAINEYSRTIRIPNNVSNEYLKLKNSGDYETNGEILDYLGIPLIANLNDKVDSEGTELISVIRDTSFISPDAYADETMDSLNYVIEQTMSVLDDRENYIIKAYFGLNGESLTLQDIADEIDLTKERVRQIKDNALRKIRFNSRNFLEYLN